MVESRFFIRIFDSTNGGLSWIATVMAADKDDCLSAASTAGERHGAVAAYSALGDRIQTLAVFGQAGFLLQDDEAC